MTQICTCKQPLLQCSHGSNGAWMPGRLGWPTQAIISRDCSAMLVSINVDARLFCKGQCSMTESFPQSIQTIQLLSADQGFHRLSIWEILSVQGMQTAIQNGLKPVLVGMRLSAEKYCKMPNIWLMGAGLAFELAVQMVIALRKSDKEGETFGFGDIQVWFCNKCWAENCR